MPSLVTGATGFLGRGVVERLRLRGEEVRVFCRSPAPELERLGARVLGGDIRDRSAVVAACAGVDTVYHVAGKSGIARDWTTFFSTNTLGTRYVLEGCRTHHVERLVYTSSPSVTFDGGHQRGVDESCPYPARWLCHYARSKALAEQEVLAANGHSGLLTCALRPHLIWGPGDRQLIPRLIERARRGRLVCVGDGANRIDIVFVDNAVEAHLLAAERLTVGSSVCGNAYFISQGEPVNCWEWVDQVLLLAGLPPVQRRLPYRVVWTLGLACEAAFAIIGRTSEPPMSRFLAAQLAKDHFFDISRARRDLGYNPAVSTSEGMSRLEPWLRNQSQAANRA